VKIIESSKQFLGSKREKFISIGSGLIVMPFVLYAEGAVSNILADLDPDLFGKTVEEVIDSQDQNFKEVNSALESLVLATKNDDKAKDIIASLSKSIENTRATNSELTTKLNSMYKDREILRAELNRKKGGDLIPGILVDEHKSVNFQDVGVVSVTDYKGYLDEITLRYSTGKSRTVKAGAGVKIESNDGKKSCSITYLGKYDDKFGLAKSCVNL